MEEIEGLIGKIVFLDYNFFFIDFKIHRLKKKSIFNIMLI